MGIDVLPPSPQETPYLSPISNQERGLGGFKPGYLKQDIYTIPIELGLIGIVNTYYTPRANPLWPFNNQTGYATSRSTTLTTRTLFPFLVGMPVTILGGLSLSNADFPILSEGIGWLHAALLTEVSTSAAKTIFQEKRPDADTEMQAGTSSYNDRASFYSGHAAQAFSFATYSSGLMIQYCPSPVFAWGYAVSSYAVASWISYTRWHDHAHHPADLVAGAVFGSLISGSVYYRVQQVIAGQKKSDTNSADSVKIEFSPSVWNDDFKRTWYAGMLEVQY